MAQEHQGDPGETEGIGDALNDLMHSMLPQIPSPLWRWSAMQLANERTADEPDGERALQTLKEHLRNANAAGTVAHAADLYHSMTARIGDQLAASMLLVLLQTARPVQPMLPEDANDALLSRFAWDERNHLTSASHLRSSKNSAQSLHDDRSAAVPESVLVREVLYCCQGISGRHIAYDPSKEHFTVRNTTVKEPAVHLIRKLCELGWLYIHIQSCTRTMGGQSNGTTAQPGLVAQALVSAVQSELREYFRYLASLEARVIGTQAKVNETTISSQRTAPMSSITSLRQLSAWLVEPFRRLRALATLVDSVMHTKGGTLLTILEEKRKSGDTRESDIARSLLVQAAEPFYAALQKWILEGQLEDTFREFFIRKEEMSLDAEKEHLWRYQYSIAEAMRPSFVSESLARDILHVGKCINFLRHCCNDSGWIEERGIISAASSNQGGLKYGNDNALERMVTLAKERLNSRVLQTMYSKYRLGEHFNALKRYMLLGQGDFVHHLMELMGRELEGSASTITAFRLESTLDTAIRGSSAKYDDDDFTERLHCRILSSGYAELGWDVFTIDYSVQPPLTTLFSEWAMERYLRIFNWLWRIKRVEHSLNSTWQRLKPNSANRLAALSRTSHEQMLAADLRRCHALRAEMSHVINNISHYMMFEGLESRWAKFQAEVDEACDLDGIIEAHENFLADVLEFALLEERSQTIKGRLEKLYETMMEFTGVARQLHDAAEEISSRRLEAKRRAEEDAGARQWAATAASTGEIGELQEQLQRVHEHLEQVAHKFQSQFGQFMQLVPLQKHIDLSSLHFRLDFSGYYAAIQ